MAPLSHTWSKIAPLSYTSRISQNNRIFLNTKMAISPALLYTASLKKAPPLGGASPYSLL